MMTETVRRILREEEAYRTVWYATYEPMRRALAGVWRKLGEDSRFQLVVDEHGAFALIDYDSNTFLHGRYTIVAYLGRYFVTLDSGDPESAVLEIEDLDDWSLRLRLTDDGSILELGRRRAPSERVA